MDAFQQIVNEAAEADMPMDADEALFLARAIVAQGDEAGYDQPTIDSAAAFVAAQEA